MQKQETIHPTRVLRCDSPQTLDAAVSEAVHSLEKGEVVALPAETVYGLAANALNPDAVARIFEAKERPFFDPLICHIPEPVWVEKLAKLDEPLRALVQTLSERFWPGPLTLVLPRQACVPELVCAGLDTVAIRMPAHPVFLSVLRAFEKPLAAPSANRFGRISPTAAEHVHDELSGRIPLILDAGHTPLGIESTILGVEPNGVRILRSGPITREELQTSVPVLADLSSAQENHRPESPGRLTSHYAPRTPLVLENPARFEVSRRSRLGLLAWDKMQAGFGQVEVLSEQGDLREAASRLFGAMRRLDQGGWDAIVAELAPEPGLGVAINDRLRRAAAKG
jgi:L-threonylcarbamoyladenylate synthase